MQNLRIERANSEVERALSNILKNKINDPRLNEFITITFVKLSVDFRHCKVGISVYTGDKKVVLNQKYQAPYKTFSPLCKPYLKPLNLFH